jgi:beta-lactamase class D
MFTVALAAVLAASPLPTPPSVSTGECVILAPLDGSPETVAGGDECDRRTLPASTFKIPHALIALDTGVVTERTTMKWDGTRQDFPAWERDHTLDSAIKSSVVWFFQRAARSIGRDRELEHLRRFAYGSQTFAKEVDRFWLNGDLTISPREQIAFLKRMYSYQLPVARAHVDTVIAAMTMPPGKLSNAAGMHEFALRWPNPIVRAKTGNGTVNGERASWVIGEIESEGRQFVFASRVRSSTRTLETTAGADLALRVLNAAAPQRTAARHKNAGIDLLAQGKPAFGVYVPAARKRVKEVLDLGGDGVTVPHAQNVAEAQFNTNTPRARCPTALEGAESCRPNTSSRIGRRACMRPSAGRAGIKPA